MKTKNFVWVISTLFAILFLYTGISKLLNFGLFKAQLATSPILVPIATVVALVMPVTEIVVSVLVYLPATRLKGLYASLYLMVLFIAYIVAILLFDPHVPCSCGGVIEQLSWTGHIILNSVLTVAAWVAIRLEGKLTKAVPRPADDQRLIQPTQNVIR